METSTHSSTTSSNTTEGCQPAKPQQEHAWLQKLVGTWSTESNCLGPDGQPMPSSPGTEVVKRLGDLWVVGEGEGSMPDGEKFQMRITLGFDPKRNRYVGSWVGTMMPSLWVYEGQLDASGKILTLEADGPSFTDPTKTAKYQDIIEFKHANERTLTSRCQGEDGQWFQFMTITYRRTA